MFILLFILRYLKIQSPIKPKVKIKQIKIFTIVYLSNEIYSEQLIALNQPRYSGEYELYNTYILKNICNVNISTGVQ